MSTQPSAAPEPSTSGPRAVVLRGLSIERDDTAGGTRRILDSISFAIAPCAVVAVTGPSGAGKTSLLHAIAGLVTPEAGTVSWGDLDITALPETARDRWRRDTVGLVFQDFHLLDELSVLENILLPTRFDRWWSSAVTVAKAKRLAAGVGLDRPDQRTGALSRGEQQRVAIARALMRDPQLVLADEPTANLDTVNGTRVMDLLIGAARRAQASVVVVSHDPAALARADIVLRLEAGKLAP